jgi:hypothetical protein
VRVTVYRTAARGNSVATMMAAVLKMAPSADIVATATAAAQPANAARCVLPFTIPDKWVEHTTAGEFNKYDKKGVLLPNPDYYVPPGTSGATGYNHYADKGVQLTLKSNNSTKVAPSMYNPWDLPGSVGGDDYRENISDCNSNLVAMGDMMTPENGNMTGPTQQGTTDLIAQDPKAKWDTSCNCVVDSAFGISPRIRIVPLYNPVVYADGQQSGKSGPQLQVVNYLGFFVEDVYGGGNVLGRITPVLGEIVAGSGPAIGGFAQVIRLVE